MAPTAPTKRRTLRAKLAARTTPGPYEPRKAPRPDAAPPASDGFSNSKKDKRQIKHASFVSRIEKPAQKGKNKTRPLKRRRPGNKLKTDLGALADALPDVEPGEEGEGEALREGKVRHESLRAGKGALKRKERIVRGEVERFGVSLARLNVIGASAAANGGGDGGGNGIGAEAQGMQVESENSGAANETQAHTQQASGSTVNRWAALRGFISATMEQNPAFVGKQDVGK